MWRHVTFTFLSPVPPVCHSYFIVSPCNPGQPDFKVHALAIIPTASQSTEGKIPGINGGMSIHTPCRSSHPECPFSSYLRLLVSPLEGIPTDPHSICLCLATAPFYSVYWRSRHLFSLTEKLPSGLSACLPRKFPVPILPSTGPPFPQKMHLKVDRVGPRSEILKS